MEECNRNMTIENFQYFQLLSLLLAIICRHGLYKWQMGAFIPLLIIINCLEITGVNFRLFGWANNYFIYNIYLLSSTFFMLWIFYRMLVMDKRMREIFQVISVLLLSFMLLNICFLQGFWKFNTYSLITAELVNIVLSCIVLFQLVFTGDDNKGLFNHPFFWFNVGTLFFSLGTIVLFGLHDYIIKHQIFIKHKSLYHALSPILNVIMYSSWGYGFIQCRKK